MTIGKLLKRTAQGVALLILGVVALVVIMVAGIIAGAALAELGVSSVMVVGFWAAAAIGLLWLLLVKRSPGKHARRPARRA